MAPEDGKSYREGPAAAERFNGTMSRLLRVSKVELAKREAAYQKSRRTKKTPSRPTPR